MKGKIEKTLNLTLQIEDGEVKVISSEPESGETATFGTFPLSCDEHPEFNEAVGNEIYSWISLWADEADDETEESTSGNTRNEVIAIVERGFITEVFGSSKDIDVEIIDVDTQDPDESDELEEKRADAYADVSKMAPNQLIFVVKDGRVEDWLYSKEAKFSVDVIDLDGLVGNGDEESCAEIEEARDEAYARQKADELVSLYTA